MTFADVSGPGGSSVRSTSTTIGTTTYTNTHASPGYGGFDSVNQP